jgi:hypothetical protein
VLEVALVRLSRREAGPPLQTVIERIEGLERGGAGVAAAPPARPAPKSSTAAEPAPPPEPTAPQESSGSPRATLGALRRAEGAPDVASPRPAPQPARREADTEASDAGDSDTPAAAADEPGGGDVDLDDVIVAWGAIVPDLSPATRSAVQNAQPVRFDGDVLVFGVAPELLHAARERFKREADTVREALAARLGRRFKFNLEAAPQFSMATAGPGDAAPPRASAVGSVDAAPAPDAAEPVDESYAPEDLVDAPPDLDAAPVSRLRSELGATVVEELPRDT